MTAANLSTTLEMQGFTQTVAHYNLSQAQLIEHAIQRGEGWLSEHGALIAHTGAHTGRSAQDKFVVRGPIHGPDIWWASPYQRELEGASLKRCTATS